MKKAICVVNSKGLHARPATVFAETAQSYEGTVSVSYGKKKVNGKSLIALMSLAVPRNAEIEVEVDGDEAAQLISVFEEVLSKNYDG